MVWDPSEAMAARELEQPFGDVPVHLHEPLTAWVLGRLTSAQRAQRLAIHLRLAISDPARNLPNARAQLRSAFASQPTRLLQASQFALDIFGGTDSTHEARRLDAILREGNSLYVVQSDGHGLERRIDAEVSSVINRAVESASQSARQHLSAAWNATYGLTPNPTLAVSEAIKAVESAGASVISPNNDKTTLGTMIRDVSIKPAKWILAEGYDAKGVERLLEMMRLLWDSQTARHGGQAATRRETATEAELSLHLAALLVHLFSAEIVRLA